MNGNSNTDSTTDKQPWANDITDIFLAAYLAYKGCEYRVSVHSKTKRASFVFMETGSLINDYYKRGMHNANVLEFVEKIRAIKTDMYKAKEESRT